MASIQQDLVVTEGNTSQKTGRKKTCAPTNWAKNIAKAKRNSGKEYLSVKTGRVVAARQIGTPCRDGCFDKVTLPVIRVLFSDFWAIGNYDSQTAYIQKLIHKVPVKRHRPSKTPDNPGQHREFMFDYSVVYQNETFSVCRQAFTAIFGITRKRVACAMRKTTPTHVPVLDQRGRHEPAGKITGDKAQCVRDHINQLQTVTSHYSRARNPHRKYLESNLTISKLYKSYEEWMSANHPETEKVTQSYYHKTFTKEFNIGFQPPRSDTCSTCDRLTTSINSATNETEKQLLENQRKQHKEKASQGQQLMKDKKEDMHDNVAAICIDLQQTIPIPKLSTNVAYYHRKLWMYNCCIHNLKMNKATMFVWDEVTGGRGSVEIASCLKKWIGMEYDEKAFQHLIVFSDNCGGQNKNINIILNYLHEVHSGRLKTIEHVYLMPGHSFLPCDSAFGNIERKFMRESNIYDFDSYCNIIQNATSSQYRVVRMSRQDFLNIGVLKQCVVNRKPNIESVSFIEARMFVFNQSYKEGYFIAMTYSAAPLTPVRLMPGKRSFSQHLFDLSLTTLPQKYAAPIVLNVGKLASLKQLLAFIDTAKYPYIKQLISHQERQTSLPPSPSNENDTELDAENDLLEFD